MFEYQGRHWHEDCFVCMVCQEPIRNNSFIPKEEKVVCIPCYERDFAQKCIKCKGVINKGGLVYKSQPWHKECFTCIHCHKELAKEKFTTHEENPYCVDCYGELFADKCIRCTKPITGFGGTKFISFDGHHWHSDCFVCYTCNVSMVGKGFLINEGSIFCPSCGQH